MVHSEEHSNGLQSLTLQSFKSKFPVMTKCDLIKRVRRSKFVKRLTDLFPPSCNLSWSFESWLTRPSRHLSPIIRSQNFDDKPDEYSSRLHYLSNRLPLNQPTMTFRPIFLRCLSGGNIFFVEAAHREMSTFMLLVWFGLFHVVYFSKEDEEWKEFEQREVDYSGLRLQALQMRWEKK